MKQTNPASNSYPIKLFIAISRPDQTRLNLQLGHLYLSHVHLQVTQLPTTGIKARRHGSVVLANRPPVGRRDLMTGSELLLVMLGDDVTDGALEVDGSLLHLRVQLAVDEDACVEVLLGVGAEVFILRHDSLVHVADGGELLVVGVVVAVDFVAHDALSWADWGEALHEEEVGAGTVSTVSINR